AERIDRPVIFFQGLDDRIVLPQQSRQMAAALRDQGIPHALVEFEGEGHGFRSADTIITALESEHAFYRRILELDCELPMRKLDIHCLDESRG
ncbi:MAG: prolyl oligopeptidase family serine peptidase, partial [Gammaproteobacteria bacterium]|nr:prolyl oligopeptidase family serine peptidase [Gammaproteobacteria bacterium]